MDNSLFEDVFAALQAMRLSASDVTRLRIWTADMARTMRPTPPAGQGLRQWETGGAMHARGRATKQQD